MCAYRPRHAGSEPNPPALRQRELRVSATPPEGVLWSMLRNGRLNHLKFRRQHPIGPYVADFYCHEALLVVELDGAAHADRADRDRQRDAYMRTRGLEIVRISVGDLTTSPDAVLGYIAKAAGLRLH